MSGRQAGGCPLCGLVCAVSGRQAGGWVVSQTGELFPCVDWSVMCQVGRQVGAPCVDWSVMCQVGRQVGGWSAKQVSCSPVWTGLCCVR